MPDAEDLGVTLIPAAEVVDADVELDAAVRSVLGPLADPVDEPPDPIGMSWDFDLERGRFKRAGSAPVETHGRRTLELWCELAASTARHAHAVFSDQYGLEDPFELIGHADPTMLMSDFERRFIEALLVHDRISAIENYEADYDPTTGVAQIIQFDVVTDEGEVTQFGDVTVKLDLGSGFSD